MAIMLAKYLDSTNLQAEARASDIESLCQEARQFQVAAVCVNPFRLELACHLLAGTPVKACTVIAFPLGADHWKNKVDSARRALQMGAAELDMVMNIGAFKDRDYRLVEREIKELLRLREEYAFLLKVIVETALLSKGELQDISALLSNSEADFIKTSTGFSSRGVTLEDIEIIRESRQRKDLKIKASGGIKSLDFALELLKAGVDRIGSSSALALLEEYRQRGGQ
ncbi:MAG TPA: deoxyribose-phosphate aldolase [Syntrophomonas wolfei]|jgi:deoxyribose-phosphate aldolase|uniref:Deoxyribose-phosphate aldolase n=2 Tax=Syntrophomonas wolfei TaxID=863 RepID=A0A354YVD1_9FIRM|nr:deoxyribose-phosphate aldolase [Syntrophomonas wolfei]